MGFGGFIILLNRSKCRWLRTGGTYLSVKNFIVANISLRTLKGSGILLLPNFNYPFTHYIIVEWNFRYKL